MPSRVILFSGASAVGKTAAVKALLPLLNIAQCCVCKIDCLRTQDDEAYRRMGVPCVTGLSRDICPDHFLVSNLPELWQWADAQNRPTLLLETAGLCHRCSPATREMIAGCVARLHRQLPRAGAARPDAHPGGFRRADQNRYGFPG